MNIYIKINKNMIYFQYYYQFIETMKKNFWILNYQEEFQYTLVDRVMYSMKVKLIKTITKSGDTITQTNYLTIGSDTSFAVDVFPEPEGPDMSIIGLVSRFSYASLQTAESWS